MSVPHELQIAAGLMQSQQLDGARKILKQFTKRNSKHADGWWMLGQVERALQQWPHAIDALQKAQALHPHPLAVTEFLAMTRLFSNQGRHVAPAIEEFSTVLGALPDAPQATALAVNLQTLALRTDRREAVLRAVEPFFNAKNPQGAERQRMAAGLCIAHFLQNNVAQTLAYAAETMALSHYAFDAAGKPVPGDYPFYQLYVEFIQALLAQRESHPALYAGAATGVMHAVGESHGLTPSQLVIGGRRVQSHLMMGAKAYAFTNAQGESWQFALRHIIQTLPKDEPIVAVFGEIDCRNNEGIMQQWAKQPDYAMEQHVAALVAAYVKFVKMAQLKRLAPTYIYGVPAPSRAAEAEIVQGRTAEDFTRMIAHYNACLAAQAQKQALPFIDIYAATLGADGWARDGVHIDKVHLTPTTVAEAFAAVIR